MKNYIYIIAGLLLVACGEEIPVKQQMEVSGFAQGTTYKILYISDDGVDYQRSIDSLLIEIDNSMSTYNKNSLISKWNKSSKGDGIMLDINFNKVYNVSAEVYKLTGGAFDPTVGRFIELWEGGFVSNIPDSLSIFIAQYSVGMDKVEKRSVNNILYKLNSQLELNFNAVAQGYTVDVLGELLQSKGINNYLVEVGGELRAKGINLKDTLWRVGIDRPLPDLKEREIEAIVHLNNLSLATSGNYRKFYEKDGMKYSHTINPKTGYPVQHNLLSATVITDECAYADAYATAFMVMGLEKSKTFLSDHNELMALLIYSDENGDLQTYTTNNLLKFIELNPDKK